MCVRNPKLVNASFKLWKSTNASLLTPVDNSTCPQRTQRRITNKSGYICWSTWTLMRRDRGGDTRARRLVIHTRCSGGYARFGLDGPLGRTLPSDATSIDRADFRLTWRASPRGGPICTSGAHFLIDRRHSGVELAAPHSIRARTFTMTCEHTENPCPQRL